MGSYTLIVGVLKYFLIFGGFVRFDSDPLGFCSMVLLSIFAFLCPPKWSTWREFWLSTPVLCDHGIVHLDCWSIKIFSHFFGFCPLWFLSFGAFVLWCFCPLLLFSVLPYVIAWRECWLSTPVSCDHGIVHLDCWSIKIFSHFYWFCPLWFWSFVLSFYGAFVHFCFSLSANVIAWREFWLSTPVSCDHMIVHLDFWSIKIFSHFWGFCPLWFWSFGSFVLWCFCPFLLFSVHPRHRMTRMLVVHTCIRWSWDRTPWLLEY